MLNKYETIIIFRGNTTEKEYDTLVSKYHDILIKDLDARTTDVDKMGKRKLAYEVKGNTEGWYVRFEHYIEVGKIVDLERQLRIDDDVLKFMTIRIEDDVEESKIPAPESTKSEQNVQVDALDVLLGFAEYKTKK